MPSSRQPSPLAIDPGPRFSMVPVMVLLFLLVGGVALWMMLAGNREAARAPEVEHTSMVRRRIPPPAPVEPDRPLPVPEEAGRAPMEVLEPAPDGRQARRPNPEETPGLVAAPPSPEPAAVEPPPADPAAEEALRDPEPAPPPEEVPPPDEQADLPGEEPEWTPDPIPVEPDATYNPAPPPLEGSGWEIYTPSVPRGSR